MKTTVRELIDVLKDYSEQMEITVNHADQKFEIIDFQSEANTLNIIINEKEYEDDEG